MEITAYIDHPERLDKDSLYKLRELVGRYPYYAAARLMFLQNLFLLHDPSFGEELRRAALFLPDRHVLFHLFEGSPFDIKNTPPIEQSTLPAQTPHNRSERANSLIDNYLQEDPVHTETPHRQPTAADATTEYTAFLLQLDDAEPEEEETVLPSSTRNQRSKTLVENFIAKPGRIELKEEPEFTPELPEEQSDEKEGISENFFTETLARIYIKQGRFEKAIEIIRKLNLVYPKKNAYFADQIRFLEKVIANNQHKK